MRSMLFGAINNWKKKTRKQETTGQQQHFALLYFLFSPYPQAAMLTLQLTGPFSTGSIVSVMYSLYTPQ